MLEELFLIALFRELQQLFGEDINRLTVYQWSTDWIDFLNFQPDQYEFWGSYLWTVSRPFPAPMLGIAASATE